MIQETDDGFAITVLAAPHVPRALVCLSGEIDMRSSAKLTELTAVLSTVAPATVVIDLAEVTFACAALPNFLARLHRCLPADSAMLLYRPTAGTRRVLQATGMDLIATLCTDLPTAGRAAA